ncbi:MAG: imidazoleglycerol-phosphate dehydratase HisB [Elusimicrobiota bacterium]|nr:imidazoleglycerol-phosphate dehydratase HisB [Elusimicrobiota bacterium]
MKVKIKRITKETQVYLELNLRGKGKYKIDTSIPFFDHMLSQFALHGNFNLKLLADGDRELGDHHLIEDIGIALGNAIKKFLRDKRGIKRYGNFLMPMDEALSYVVVDISSRPYLKYNVKFKKPYSIEFDFSLIEEFFQALVANAGITLHISMKAGQNNHHIAESIFKGFGKALSEAVSKSRVSKGVPSTKGKL